ncbi:MAG: cytochrome d ubiquinol oxidase subunit II [Planctomycetota bacterium]
MTLQSTWFLLIGVLLTGYAILDGFDLGVGFWHLFTRGDKERRTLLNAIGPVWDGNEVWLLTGGGAIFAAFPHVYATVFSGMYLALMLVLLALIFRAVSLEFRSKDPSPRWRSAWDVAFSLGSMLPALLFGVAVGNILRGLPLDESMNYTGSFFTLLNPYALVVGLIGFSMFATHGALYLVLKTEGDLANRARTWARKAWMVFVLLFLVGNVLTFATQSRLLANYNETPLLWVIPVLAFGAIILTGIFNRTGADGKAFLFSCISILGLITLCAVALFPNMVPALGRPELSLTITNASSSALTLKTMLILALIGMPIVIGYTIWVYRIFSGKVKLNEDSY